MIVYTDKHRIPFQIDDEDWEIVRHYSWSIDGDGYVVTNIRRLPKHHTLRQRSIFLHQLLLGNTQTDLEWDHKNQNRLDNRRSNLRIASHVLNQQNTGLRIDNKSGTKGVYSYRNGWIAEIRVNGVAVYLGYFSTKEQAVKKRIAAEKECWK